MLPIISNLLSPAATEPAEQFFTLLQNTQLRLEQIVSHGQVSPAGFWYEQPGDEWVMLLCGTASLEFIGGSLTLVAGDTLLIPAGCRHRVAICSADARWLALHLTPGG